MNLCFSSFLHPYLNGGWFLISYLMHPSSLSLPEVADFLGHPWSPLEARALPCQSSCCCSSAYHFLKSQQLGLLQVSEVSPNHTSSSYSGSIPGPAGMETFHLALSSQPSISDPTFPPCALVSSSLGVLVFSFFPRRLYFASGSCLLLVYLVSTQTTALGFPPVLCYF